MKAFNAARREAAPEGFDDQVGDFRRDDGSGHGLATGLHDSEERHADHERDDHGAGAPGGMRPGVAEQTGSDAEKDRQYRRAHTLQRQHRRRGQETPAAEDQRHAADGISQHSRIAGEGYDPKDRL